MTLQTEPFNITDYITPDIADEYLQAVLEDGDPLLLKATLRDLAKIKGMTNLARETKLNRESLYRALSETGNPSFNTITKIVNALGYKITLQPA